MKRLFALSTLTLAVATPAFGQDCTDEPGNLVENCGFDTEIPPWNDFFGTAIHDSGEGFFSNGSASLSGEETGNGHELQLRQCITPVASERTYRFGGALRGGATPPDECLLTAATRSATDCGGGGTFAWSTLMPSAGAWVSFTETELTTLAGTVAVLLDVTCIRADSDFGAHFDDAYFGETAALFSDGFEDGDTSDWSSSVP